MRRKNDVGMGLLGRHSVDVFSIAIYRHSPGLVSQPAQFIEKEFTHCGFIPGNGFNVNQLPREGDRIHGGENIKRPAS